MTKEDKKTVCCGEHVPNGVSAPLFVFSLIVFLVFGFYAGSLFGKNAAPTSNAGPLVVSYPLLLGKANCAVKAREDLEKEKASRAAQLGTIENELKALSAAKVVDKDKLQAKQAEAKQLIDRLNQELANIEKQKTEEVKKVLDAAIASMAQSRKSAIYEKASVLVGGTDITEDVLTQVNGQSAAPVVK